MKIPFINSHPEILGYAVEACRQVNESLDRDGERNKRGHLQIVPIDDPICAVDFINYHMPQLILINFSDKAVDSVGVMEKIAADPWLNHGGVIGVYDDIAMLERIDEFENTNIVISLHFNEVEQQMRKVLEVIKNNEHILFQRTIQKDLLSELSGSFVLDNDISIISCYANLIANYLQNMGFVENRRKAAIGLSLSEMLINAIEHGNCGITAADKTAHLATGETIHSLIEQKCRAPDVAARHVHFGYEIQPAHSSYVIRDEGKGFDWRSYVNAKEIDYMADHGRGIWLTVNSVDRVEYNESGTEVRLHINHRVNVANAVPSIFGNNEVVEFQPDEYVFRQGEDSDFLYYIAEGEYRVVVNDRQINTINSTDILIGEIAFLLEETRSASVIANSPGKLIKIPKESFIESIKSQPYYGVFLSKLLAERLQRLSQKYTS